MITVKVKEAAVTLVAAKDSIVIVSEKQYELIKHQVEEVKEIKKVKTEKSEEE